MFVLCLIILSLFLFCGVLAYGLFFGGTSVCSMVFFSLEFFFLFFFCQRGHANLYIRKCRAVEITRFFYNTRSGFFNNSGASYQSYDALVGIEEWAFMICRFSWIRGSGTWRISRLFGLR